MSDPFAAPDLSEAKAVVRGLYNRMFQDPAALKRRTGDSYLWRGYHPFHEITDPAEVTERFWRPLLSALTSIQRREDVFIAGRNSLDEFASTWVVSMGHLMGLFDQPWLGIRPTRKLAMLRYCEFNRVEGGKIRETALFFDIPHLMAQAGQNPFPPQTGAFMVQPGPACHTGLCHGPQDPEEGRRTLAAIDHMCGDIATWSGGREEPLEDELRRSWQEDMVWWGPHGIGATYTVPRYAQQHSGPFRQAFQSRTFNGHVARIAEGAFGGFFGWPNLTLEHKGGFMGFPESKQSADMRVIDIYRRSGDKLVENWIFIDLLHFWNMQGVDILGRSTAIGD